MIDKDHISDDTIGKELLELDDYAVNSKISEKIRFSEVSVATNSLSFTKSSQF